MMQQVRTHIIDVDILDLDNYDPRSIQDSPLRLCSYLPDRASQLNYMLLGKQTLISAELYDRFAQYGFRRSGTAFYRPNCRHCMQCISARVVVNDFKPSRRFRRVLTRNEDVSVTLSPTSTASSEHFALYERYISMRHADGDMYPPSRHTFEQFLVHTPARTYFIEFREPNGKLLAVAVTDEMSDGLSSVYTFFDPSPVYDRRSLGVLCVLKQIEMAQRLGLTYDYLGYWIPTVKKMSYKVDYTPIELLINGEWMRFDTTPNRDDILDLLHTFPAYSYL